MERKTNGDIQSIIKSLKSSIPEQVIFYHLREFFPDCENSKMFGWLAPQSIDIYIPSLSLGIEYDGSYWHIGRSKSDSHKTKLCLQHDITLLRIREGEQSLGFDSNQIFYKPTPGYTNIDEPISQIAEFIESKYGCHIANEANIDTDSAQFYTFVQEQYYQKTLAYIWPEIVDFWDYSLNSDLAPENVMISDRVQFVLTCPKCGLSSVVILRYKSKCRSMPTFCDCEINDSIRHRYFDYALDYYRQHGNLDINDSSLFGRRAYDWLQYAILYSSMFTCYERKMFGMLGIEPKRSNVTDRTRGAYLNDDFHC